MDKFTRLSAIAAPLLRANIDTDTIIRGGRSALTPRDELGNFLFEAVRLRADGSEDPEFILNREPYRGAKILIGGDNFGCGSSRESAVWALTSAGFRCVIAPSFGGIFFGNCFQNGVLAVQLPRDTVMRLGQALLADPERSTLEVDLERQRITGPDGEQIAFDYDPYRKQALLDGLDDIGMTLKRESDIARFQAEDRKRRPWIHLSGKAP